MPLHHLSVSPAAEAQSNIRWIFLRHRLFFDYYKILGCCSTTLLLYLRHPSSFGDKDLAVLNSCFKSPFLPSVSKGWGRTSACTSWSFLFSKHMVILTALSEWYPTDRSSFCKDLPLVTETLSCGLCLTFPWQKGATEDFYPCSSLCYMTTYHLSGLPFLKYTYWSSLHGVTFTNFSKQRKDRMSG